ncbi:MAG TPA: hypothetical protein O0X39_01705 [Methanocorpusculum sp.]|nr:hypothetical protein [Methanocorpusculum sp.]
MNKILFLSAALLVICAVILSAGCIQINTGSQTPAPTPTPQVIVETVYVETTPTEYGTPDLYATYIDSSYDRDQWVEYANFEVYNAGPRTATKVTLNVDARYSSSIVDASGSAYVGTVLPWETVTVTVPIYYNSDRDYMDNHTFDTDFKYSYDPN